MLAVELTHPDAVRALGTAAAADVAEATVPMPTR
jgi:hypothetical protein